MHVVPPYTAVGLQKALILLPCGAAAYGRLRRFAPHTPVTRKQQPHCVRLLLCYRRAFLCGTPVFRKGVLTKGGTVDSPLCPLFW